MVGSERQFNKCASEITRHLLFECNHPAPAQTIMWNRQFIGLFDQVRRFFRVQSNAPCLAWTSPIFLRGVNWIAEEGLSREDRTLEITPYKIETSSPIPVLFPSDGSRHEVDVSQLVFHYPHRPKFFVTVPRIRTVVYPGGVSSPRDECIALADVGEVNRLNRGEYSPNNAYHRVERGLKFLDFFTVMLARFRVPSSPTATVRGLDLARANLTQTNRYHTSRHGLSGIKEETWVDFKDVVVQFVRLTFEPNDLSIVVFLSAERRFDRFLKEHAGLQETLLTMMLSKGFS
jgi:hypothetical protein